MTLKGKVAVITGSTSGIGLATARVLAQNGADIMLHGLMSQQDGEALASELASEFGVKVCFDDADMRDPAATKALLERTVAKLGSVDILVNNAGIQHTETVDNFPEQKWHDIIAINLSAAFFTTQKALPVMKKKGWGRIVNIASVHGLVGSVKKSAYCAAKHGIVGLTKVTALENADQGITVNAICPGWVNTPILQAQVDDMAASKGIDKETAKRALVTTKQPLPEMMEPSQIGELILFLCSDAARSITGASLPIDGAWTAQ
ncbi:3-hydroxybutyrate dehydrogenase [Saliniradius amylolyticus]|uniref:3-hydroxybutyrate dehydrogenase n=1 Tax=Saliniradius amylolyticus TaxID=2183582 RepID=A0A2S2E2E5_9ALTE|nr:3-hydroxybutyrate dehydrogenase [Saliniradius amylolyticus]AWL11187.1 3-hydroxybutyrate dehydrogenase [Saliniradius amylolyticus]